ncbi:hypothetical protein chiPu_0022879, partial [Chiloscyllium punctatum]|nr:hypothetical protein [Chiloscyllium punctatum]
GGARLPFSVSPDDASFQPRLLYPKRHDVGAMPRPRYPRRDDARSSTSPFAPSVMTLGTLSRLPGPAAR